MIDFVRGRVVERAEGALVLAPDGIAGLGLRVLAPIGTAQAVQPDTEITLYTHLYVREDALTLYGFAAREERGLFLQLLSVSGIGPKSALAALSAMPVQRLAAAIAEGDVKAIARVPGIGAKTAARVVLDLKGKLPAPEQAADPSRIPTRIPASFDGYDDVATALRDLGFSAAEVATALAALPVEPRVPDDEAIALALKQIGLRG